MLRIQELDFREDSDDVLIQGGARAHVSGFAQSGNGYAVATIGSSASGSFTSTTAFTSTSAVQSASLGYSSAHAFGSAVAYDKHSSSRSAARYGSFSSYRR